MTQKPLDRLRISATQSHSGVRSSLKNSNAGNALRGIFHFDHAKRCNVKRAKQGKGKGGRGKGGKPC